MFHPERLTGARRRAWLRMEEYAPVLPTDKLPKVIQKQIKHPERLKACVRVDREGQVAHYVLVVGQSLVFLNHADLEVDRSLADLSGVSETGCRCLEIHGRWATWTQRTKKDCPYELRRYWTDDLNGMPEPLVAVRERCRHPARSYRMVSKRYRRTRRRFVVEHPHAKNPVHCYPYRQTIKNRYDRYSALGLDDRAAELAQKNLSNHATEIAGIPVRVVLHYPHYNNRFCIDGISKQGAGVSVSIAADPYTWVGRVARARREVPPNHVRVSECTVGPVTICFGFDATTVRNLPDEAFEEEKVDQYVPMAAWTTDGNLIDLKIKETAHALGYMEHAMRVEHKLRRGFGQTG